MNKKIAFIGEFSGVNNNYAKLLKNSGYEVLLISDGDSFKNYDRDINISVIRPKNRFYNFMFDIGLTGLLNYYTNRKKFDQIDNYDAVFFINPIPIESFGFIGNFLLFKKLHKQNKKIFLQALGDDYYWVKFCLNKKFNYSPFDNMNYKNINKFKYSLKYVYSPFYRLLSIIVAKKSYKIIAGLTDYYYPYLKDFSHKLHFLPLYVENNNINKVIQKIKVGQKVTIFHSWQKGKELKKGNYIFEQAISHLVNNFPNKINYIINNENIEYGKYIDLVEQSDIVLDQCYSQDRGMTALYAMARGKVVFTGWENNIDNFYEIKNKNCAINALPNVKQIEQEITNLIFNNDKIYEISKNAQDFINLHHSKSIILNQLIQIIYEKEEFN